VQRLPQVRDAGPSRYFKSVPPRKAQVVITHTHYAASVDLDECIERLYRKELLADSVIEAICAKTKELLMKESNVVHIAAPVTVVGDIHGQFFDMLEIFRIGGNCPDTNYLFLGRSFTFLLCRCYQALFNPDYLLILNIFS
jgi:hypothetical protein